MAARPKPGGSRTDFSDLCCWIWRELQKCLWGQRSVPAERVTFSDDRRRQWLQNHVCRWSAFIHNSSQRSPTILGCSSRSRPRICGVPRKEEKSSIREGGGGSLLSCLLLPVALHRIYYCFSEGCVCVCVCFPSCQYVACECSASLQLLQLSSHRLNLPAFPWKGALLKVLLCLTFGNKLFPFPASAFRSLALTLNQIALASATPYNNRFISMSNLSTKNFN